MSDRDDNGGVNATAILAAGVESNKDKVSGREECGNVVERP